MTIEEIKNISEYLYMVIQKRISERDTLMIFDEDNEGQLLSDAFNWGLTPEGADFWGILNNTMDATKVKTIGEVAEAMDLLSINKTNTRQDVRRKDDLVRVIDFLMSQRGNDSVLKIIDHINIINDDKNSIYAHLYIGSAIRNDILEFLCENLRGMKWRIHLSGDIVHLSIDMPK